MFEISDSYDAAVAMLDELRHRHPDNIDAMFYCSIYYKMLGLALERTDLILKSQECIKKTKWLSLGKEQDWQRAYDQIS